MKQRNTCNFFLLLISFLTKVAITMYIRYRQVHLAMSSNEIVLPTKWNEIAFWSGNTVCLGVSMVGNFQRSTMTFTHFIGAFLAFGIAAVYLLAQTRISFAYRSFYDKYPEYEIRQSVVYYRLFLTVFYFSLFIVVITCGIVSTRQAKANKMISWSEEIDGYYVHLGSTIAEWVMFLAFLAYTLTGTKEFKMLEYEDIRFKRKRSSIKT